MPSENSPGAARHERSPVAHRREQSRSPFERVSTAIGRHQLLSFFVLAFAWTWTYLGIVRVVVGTEPGILVRGLVGVWGPLFAAGFVTWASGGPVREWAAQVTKWRVKPRWYLAAFAIPILLPEISYAVYALSGVELSFLRYPAYLYALNFLVVLLVAGSTEELGWRGFAHPRIQERYSALVAALVVGVAWAVWHLPHFVLFDSAAYQGFPRYLLVVVSQSVIFAWLYNSTGGSVLPIMLMHAAGDMPGLFETVSPIPESVAAITDVLGLAVWPAAALLVIGYYGASTLAARTPDPPISGVSSNEDGSATADGSGSVERSAGDAAGSE